MHRRPTGPDYCAIYGLNTAPLRYPERRYALSFVRAMERPRRVVDGRDGTFWVVWPEDAARLEARGFAAVGI